ncbi:MAG: hypothetical protein ACXVB1_00180 [Pseudobdellovibrionaceae bacterium]
MKSKNDLAEFNEKSAKDAANSLFQPKNLHSDIAYAGFVNGARWQFEQIKGSRDAEIAALKEEIKDCRLAFSILKNEYEQEKRNLLSAAETDLMRMAELREENKYLRYRLEKFDELRQNSL